MKKRKTKTALLWLISMLLPLMQPGQPVEAADMPGILPSQGAFGVTANMQGILLGQGAYEEATDDWETMLERLDAAIANGKGENVNYSAGNRFTVPEGILEKLAGKNATLGLHTSNGVTFSISGKDVAAAGRPVNVEVIFDAEIPEDAVSRIEGYPIVKQFRMLETENYPCRVNVHMALGEENVGKHAVLYSYDETAGSLRQEDSFRITKDGHAIFGLTRGDEYIVALMDGYTVQPGDTFSHIALKYGVGLRELKEANPKISDIDKIRVGELVNIPKVHV